jgi:hypothetical protein
MWNRGTLWAHIESSGSMKTKKFFAEYLSIMQERSCSKELISYIDGYASIVCLNYIHMR